ncbi:MAG: hypothetical protein D6776_09560 [Planctomycetota bacterium]|nr:MAG: hypothetical protein D6776_09560 [Planctomycetota bacterium]
MDTRVTASRCGLARSAVGRARAGAGLALVLFATTFGCGAGAPGGENKTDALRVLVATSLAPAVRAIAAPLARAGISLQLETGPSLVLVRKVTDLGQRADLLVLADLSLFEEPPLVAHLDGSPQLVALDRMVLAHRPGAPGLAEARAGRWPEVLLRPAVRFGIAAPDLAPCGYRTLLVWRLAERTMGQHALAARLEAACPAARRRASLGALVALVQSGELDYAFLYASTARAAGLGAIELGPEIDLSDPARADTYARVALPRGAGGAPVRGAPIRCAAAVLRGGARETARRLLQRLRSDRGRATLRGFGFVPPPQRAAGRTR